MTSPTSPASAPSLTFGLTIAEALEEKPYYFQTLQLADGGDSNFLRGAISRPSPLRLKGLGGPIQKVGRHLIQKSAPECAVFTPGLCRAGIVLLGTLEQGWCREPLRQAAP
jgi:hypothetical protein